MVVDTSNPSTPKLLENLQIPGMALVLGIATYGPHALVIGSSGDFNSGGSPVTAFTGDVVVATLDLTDPQNPTIISTQKLNIPSLGLGNLITLGVVSSPPAVRRDQQRRNFWSSTQAIPAMSS